MKQLKTFFSSPDWYKLRPAKELLVARPGSNAPARFVVAAKIVAILPAIPKGPKL